MLEIIQKDPLEVSKTACVREIARQHELLPEQFSLVEAMDGDKGIGYGIFRYNIESACVELYLISASGDMYLYDGLVRAILFKAVLAGLERAYYFLQDLSDVRALGLCPKDKNYLESIENVLDSCKNCKKSC